MLYKNTSVRNGNPPCDASRKAKVLIGAILALSATGGLVWFVVGDRTETREAAPSVKKVSRIPDAPAKHMSAKPIFRRGKVEDREADKPKEGEVCMMKTADLAGSAVQAGDGLVDPEFQPETMKQLQTLFEKMERKPESESAFLHDLSCYRKSAVLAAAKSAMRFGTRAQKAGALFAVGSLFSSSDQGGRMVGGDSESKQSVAPADPGENVSTDGETINRTVTSKEPAKVSEQPMTQEELERQSQSVIGVVSSGLADADADVRSVAFSAMRSLSAEESGVLASQVLCGEDADMKMDLMREAGESSDFNDLRISLMGMGNADQAVRAQAAANLKAASGQDFTTQEQAANWLEQSMKTMPPDAVDPNVQTQTVN